jgi:hypothetical protein
VKHRPEPPCEHWDEQIGTVGAGDIRGKGAFQGVATCAVCVEKSRGFCTMMTGLPCSDLLTYEQARKETA